MRFAPDFDWTGITVVLAADVPENVVALIEDDQPILAAKEIRHCYEPVALLACEDPERLARAVAAVSLEVDELPPVLTIADSLARKALLHKMDNVQKSYSIKKGDVAAARRDRALSEVVVSGSYSMHHQEQLYIENNAMIAVPGDDGGVHVHGSLQCPYYVHKALKRALWRRRTAGEVDPGGDRRRVRRQGGVPVDDRARTRRCSRGRPAGRCG